MGKQKLPTLRNVAKAPGRRFPKAYKHNGVIKSLKEVVHFHNTRDVEEWPAPEVAEKVNTEALGNLGLTDKEERAVVAFMETLSDGYRPKTRPQRLQRLFDILIHVPLTKVFRQALTRLYTIRAPRL